MLWVFSVIHKSPQPTKIFVNFWCTAIAYDPNPPINDFEARPLKEYLIKFSVINGKKPLILDYKTFVKSTRLDYAKGTYVSHPSPEAVKAELAKIVENLILLDRTPINSIQQMISYCLITRIKVDIEEIIYSDLVTKLTSSDYTQDETFASSPTISSNLNFSKDSSKVTEIELASPMIDVNNQKDSMSPLPFSGKKKKVKPERNIQLAGTGFPSTQLDEGTRKSQPLPESTTIDPKDSGGNVQPADKGLPSMAYNEGMVKTKPLHEGTLRDKDSEGLKPPADMELLTNPIVDPSGTGAKYQVDETQSTRLRYWKSDNEEVFAAREEMDEYIPPTDKEVQITEDQWEKPKEAAVSYAGLRASIEGTERADLLKALNEVTEILKAMTAAAQNTYNTSIRSILLAEKLTGSNFTNWYQNLRIVLRYEKKIKFVEQHAGPPNRETADPDTIDKTLEKYNAYDMLKELKTMFEEHAKKELFETVKAFHACEQEEGRSNYDQFVQNYNMHSMGKTIVELHVMLKLHKKGIPKKAETPAVLAIREGKFKKDKKKPQEAKGKDKGKNKLAYAPKPKIPPPPKRDNPAKDSVCHHYKEVGHWKRNCPSYQAELKKRKNDNIANTSNIFTIEPYVFPNKTWVYDTVCGTHICNTSQGLRGSRKLKHGALSLGNGMRAVVEAIGSFDLVLSSGLIIVLDNCHFAPTITRAKHALDSSYLWHCRLGRMDKLQPDRILQLTHDESLEKCKSCIFRKMVRKPFPHQMEKAKDLLGLIHTDVCGPFRIMSREGARYFITFTNNFSHYGYVYLMKHKHEVFETFKVFQYEVEN
ncbi:zinc finger, CCHC-type containing protein [Tanacetum coccineum]